MLKIRNLRGMTLIELLVGIAIGTAAVLVTYMIYDRAQTTQRSIGTVNETQITGLYTMYLITQSVNNAGAVIMANRVDGDKNPLLDACPIDVNGNGSIDAGDFPTSAALPGALSLHPIPAVILPTDNSEFDVLNVFYARSYNADVPLSFSGSASTIIVPAAFDLKEGNVLVDVSAAGCQLTTITSVVSISGSPEQQVTLSVPLADSASKLIDLGEATWRTFYVNTHNNNTLTMVTWQPQVLGGSVTFTARVDPIAANVVAFRAQYGVDDTGGTPTGGDGKVDKWLNAGDESSSGSDQLSLKTFLSDSAAVKPAIDLNQIKAIRIGVALRTEEPTKVIRASDDPNKIEGGVLPQPEDVTLFELCGSPPCAPVTITLPVDANPDLIYRHRVYETVIPLQNAIWNPR